MIILIFLLFNCSNQLNNKNKTNLKNTIAKALVQDNSSIKLLEILQKI